MEFMLMLLLALTLDLLFGDPPNAFHPVAWMGKVIGLLEKPGLKFRPVWQFLYGVDLTIFAVVLFAIPAWLLLEYLEDYNSVTFVIVGGILLKSTFSYTTLRKVALKIKCLLDKDKLDEARFELRALVSRDTSKLGKPKLVSATVESVAESSGDSFVSPLFFYLIFGVPGAIAFRVVSTLDSMIGYRGRYEYLGKFASRLDDVLNYIPARLTALMITIAAFSNRKKAIRTWSTAVRDNKKTDSPNAGWPMAAAAGALGIELEKEGQYKLGQPVEELKTSKIEESIDLVRTALICWVIICLIAGGIYIAC